MSIAATIERYLADQQIPYDVVPHYHTSNSLATAAAAHVSSDTVAKAVVLEDEDDYMVPVIPASYKLKLGEVHAFTGRRHLRLASEGEIACLFFDCERGAVPALVGAYGLEAVWDESLAWSKALYVEGGDHESLIRISTADFRKAMEAFKSAELAEPA